MSLLGMVLNDFGTDKLGYQKQIDQANADLTEIMRARAEKKKEEDLNAYRQGELAQKQAQHKDLISQQEAARKQQQQQHNAAIQEKVTEYLKNGDVESARALISSSGGQPIEQTPNAPPPAPPASSLELGNLAPPDVTAEAQSVLGPTPEVPTAAPPATPSLADINADDVSRKMSVPGLVEAMRSRQPPEPEPPIEKPKKMYDLGNFDIQADRPEASTRTMMAPTVEGYQGAADAPPAPKKETSQPSAFSYRTPDGQMVTMDAEKVRTGNRQRMAKEFMDTHLAEADALFQSAAGNPPEVAAKIRAEATAQRAEIKRIGAHIASGAVEPKNAASEEELAIRQRQGQSITEKDRFLERGRNSRAAMAAEAARAGRAGDAGPGEPDTKRMTVYNSQLAEAKRNSLAVKDLQQLRNVRQSLAETKDPNGPQMQIALDTIVKEAAGGRLSVQLEQNARNAMGGLTSAENFAYRQLHDGKNMPKYVNAYRKIIRDAKKELDSQLKSDAQSFEHRVGAKSHWFKDPQMRPYVEDARRAYYEALGLQQPEEEGDQGSGGGESDEEFVNRHGK